MVSVTDLAEVGFVNPVWLSFPEETRAKLQAVGQIQAVEGSTLLFREGDAAHTACFPLPGTFLLRKTARGGRLQVRRELAPAKRGGPCLLMRGDQNLGDMHALEPGSVLMLPREQMEELAISDPALGRSV